MPSQHADGVDAGGVDAGGGASKKFEKWVVEGGRGRHGGRVGARNPVGFIIHAAATGGAGGLVWLVGLA